MSGAVCFSAQRCALKKTVMPLPLLVNSLAAVQEFHTYAVGRVYRSLKEKHKSKDDSSEGKS